MKPFQFQLLLLSTFIFLLFLLRRHFMNFFHIFFSHFFLIYIDDFIFLLIRTAKNNLGEFFSNTQTCKLRRSIVNYQFNLLHRFYSSLFPLYNFFILRVSSSSSIFLSSGVKKFHTSALLMLFLELDKIFNYNRTFSSF